ncbi:MAG: hypothetical protein GC161_17525 [Planctomycetaceae bacterium]|nr:hypothetical protein [Planctomycetaceae bacterium]
MPAAVAASAGSTGSAEAAPLLARVAVLGASASAGFNLERELGEPRSLAGLLPELMVGGAGVEVLDGADALMFLNPPARGAVQIERTLAFRPSAVLALDFLFWFAYGPTPEDQRAARFERGLAQLGRLDVPLAISDLPDMTGAKAVVMPESYVPSPATLRALNRRLASWAEDREHVTVVPLADLVGKLRRSEPVELRGRVWQADATADLLQWDRLHPTVLGSLLFLGLGLDAFDRHSKGALAAQIDWRIDAAAERLIESGR